MDLIVLEALRESGVGVGGCNGFSHKKILNLVVAAFTSFEVAYDYDGHLLVVVAVVIVDVVGSRLKPMLVTV